MLMLVMMKMLMVSHAPRGCGEVVVGGDVRVNGRVRSIARVGR